jgi:hypothetical protein
MKVPTEFELQHIYDPVKAREYYLRNRELKGRRRAQSQVAVATKRARAAADSRTGKTRELIAKDVRAKQRKDLTERIQSLSKKLQRLEAKIREKQSEEAREDRKGKAKKERAAKEAAKPDTAAEKAEKARENKKYKEKHEQELKTKAKKASEQSGGGSSSDKQKPMKTGLKTSSVSELKALATKVKGQIAVAKQKLAAL